MASKDKSEKNEETAEPEQRIVSGEELLGMLKRSEVISADRLVFVRAFERFYSAVDAARSQLLGDIQEIQNAIHIRDEAVIPDNEAANTEEE
jgi:hypothetical protein